MSEDQIVERKAVAPDDLKWQTNGALRAGNHSFQVPEQTRIRAYLSYDGLPVSRRMIVDPTKQANPRYVAQRLIDADLEFLKRALLNQKQDKDKHFETAVCMLFWLLGFSSVHYGGLGQTQNGPDCLALTPAGDIVIIECTTGHLDNRNKLSKLTARRSMLKAQLTAAGHGNINLQAIIVTAMRREEVSVDLPKAEPHQIAVICKEELEEALEKIALTPDPNARFKETQEAIAQSGLLARLVRGI